ncbi:S41 family peptidase [Paenibacillus sp. MER 180]|uniref:S41 family peptidase n=1 Tax=Paenibacillus sp. MER 180 TaxID=2939570 RepID=UPI00203FB4DB|nr:S41 family peptidase [Paenibacillus sp. MER 180]MCM3293128.1 S41 family peptidase [Paenibacillus sp. MER 180]
MDEKHLQLDRRLFIVSETIRLVERAFIHWDDANLKSDELDQMAETFFEKAVEAETRLDFQKVMWELFGRLRNAHSWYFDKLKPAPENGSLSFSLLELKEQWVVNRDLTDTLKSGDLVLSIEGKHPSEWFKAIEPYTGITNKISQNIRANQLLSSFIHSKSIEVEIEDQNNSRRTVILPRLARNDDRFNLSPKPLETEGKWIQEGKVAFIRIPSFGEPKYEQRALELVQEYGHAQTIIVDVRGNGGGSTPSQLTKKLMDRPYRWWVERSRHPEWLRKRHSSGDIIFPENYSFAEWRPEWQEPAGERERFNGQLVLLADRFVGSAAEDFIMPFKDNARATIVGEKTWGSTGQPIVRNFGEDIQVGVGSLRAFFPNGEPFEGIGITPDIQVEYKREDIYSARDAVLEKAIELI